MRAMVTIEFCTAVSTQKKIRAVAALKWGNSAGADNIPTELGGETMIDVLTKICNKIWKTGEWPTPWTQSLITLPKMAICRAARTTEPSASSVIQVRSC